MASSNGYYDRPPREEIVREIAGASGQTDAMLTRNSYSALVLNTPRLMFIDIDIPPDAPLGPFYEILRQSYRLTRFIRRCFTSQRQG